MDAECFTSGHEFLARFVPLRVGCLVTDLQMPGLSGQDLLDVLSARQAKLPAIMISGHGNIPAVVRAMESGAGRLPGEAILHGCADGANIRKAVQISQKYV